MNKDELIQRAQELQIEVPERATNAQITDLIKVAEHPILDKAVKALDAELKAEKEAHDLTTEALEKANTVIESLTAKVEALGAEGASKKGATYQDGKDNYEFKVETFRFKGEKHKAEEAVKNDALMQALIESKFIHLIQK